MGLMICGIGGIAFCVWMIYLSHRAEVMAEEHELIVENMRGKGQGRTSCFRKR